MRAWKDVPLKVKLVIYIVTGVFIILLASSSVVITTVTQQQEELAYQESLQITRTYANRYNADMKANMAIAQSLASLMVQYEGNDRAEVNAMLEQLLVDHPHLIGTYVGFEPDAFDGKDAQYANTAYHDASGRFVPYWNTIGGPISMEPLVDYETSDYYQLPKTTKQDTVTEPYFYQGALMVSYDAPIIRDGEFVGIGGVDVSLNYVDEAVSSVKAFDTGYLFMVSNSGVLLSHPTQKEWIGDKTLSDFNNSDILSAIEDIEAGLGGQLRTTDPVSGKDVIMFYEPIRTGNFSIILVVPVDEMLAGVNSLRSSLITTYIFSILFMGFVAYLISVSFTNRITDIVDDFKLISDEAIKGDLDIRANTDVEIDFKVIPEGLNEILDSLTSYSKKLQHSYGVIRKMESAVNSSSVVVFWWKYEDNFNYPVEFVSENIIQFGYTMEEFLSGNLHYAAIIHPKDRLSVSKELKTCVDDGLDHFRKDYRILTKEGQVKWVHEDTFIQRDEIGNVVYLQGTILDITTRVEAVDALKDMEEMRTKEIHHRIKNNLQVVSGMLYLESLNFKYQEVIDAFRDSENRVRSIALIHEKLYRSKDLVSLNFADYIRDLTEHLFHSFDVNLEQIELILDTGDISISMDNAVPLGIIVNELTSNALQHAFIQGQKGKICISFYAEADNYILSVMNTGKAFPEGLDFRNTESLGLQLVTNLVSQIDGTIELETEENTKFKIIFNDT